MAKIKKCEPEDLEGYISIEATIECQVCDKGTMTCNDFDPEQEFYNEGWRASIIEGEERVYCPKCAKKNKIK